MIWIFRILFWILAGLVRLPLIAIGIVAVPFSLVGSGVRNTPSLWCLWADAVTVPTKVLTAEASRWRFAYPVALIAITWWTWGAVPWASVVLVFWSLSGLLVMDEDRWLMFWEMAIRNTTRGLKWFHRWADEEHPNPDELVRKQGFISRTRLIADGLMWEYWRLSRWRDRYFEIRLGWKVVDSNPRSSPTLQLGPKR